VQSGDGLLWVIFSGDLARFDGQRFTNVPVTHATAMALGPNGDLWIGSSTDLVQIPAADLTQYGPLHPNSYPTSLSSDTLIFCLRFSRSGVLWVGTNYGLYRFDQGVLSPVLLRHDVRRIEEASNGDLLLATTNEGFVVWNGSQAAPHSIAAQLGINSNDVFH